jgi:glycosyltransferase involved in cell wall biosynthesis
MLSIVMPAHNEEQFIGPAVQQVTNGLRARGVPFEVILVENGSSDSTVQVIEALEGSEPEVRSVVLAVADYGAALREGFLTASGEIVVNFDVDLVDLDFLDRACEALSDPELAVVIGSKRAAGSVDRRPTGRKLVTGVFGSILRYGFGLEVSDTHGLKALRRGPLLPIVKECVFGKDIFDTELILRAQRSGLRIGEIPVMVSELRPPRTPIAKRIPRTLIGLGRLRRALMNAPGT